VSPTVGYIVFGGGTVSIWVTAGAGCAWSARTEAPWLTIESGTSGTGTGAIIVSVAANGEASDRDGTVTVADQSVKLVQQGRTPCSYAVAPAEVTVGAEGGTGSVTIAAPSHCGWTASSDGWITLGVTSGSGNATVSYTVSAWTGTTGRSGEIRVEGQRVTIRQSRDPRTCAYTVSPTEFVLHWHHEGGDIRVTTDAGCTWTIRDTADWLSTPGAESRTGSDTARFVASVYLSDATRRAPIEIRWPAATAGQNVWVTQEGCRYGAGPSSFTFTAAGGNGMVTVVTQPVSPSCNLGCPWTAEPSAPWIRILSGSPGTGDNPFRFEVAPNTGAARSGTVRVGGQTVVVTQAGA
jgi:hypothetical protein